MTCHQDSKKERNRIQLLFLLQLFFAPLFKTPVERECGEGHLKEFVAATCKPNIRYEYKPEESLEFLATGYALPTPRNLACD